MAIWESHIANSKDNGGLGGLNETISSLVWLVSGIIFTVLVPVFLAIFKQKMFKGFLLLWMLIAGTGLLAFYLTVQA
jgi:hypothetical protein